LKNLVFVGLKAFLPLSRITYQRLPNALASQGHAGKTDVITGPAQTSFLSYTTDRIASRADQEYA